MMGSERRSDTTPPAATAPAPIYKTYAPRIWPGLISEIGTVPGGNGPVMPSPKNLMSGIRSKYASTPPAHMMDAIRGPMM